MCRAVNVHRKTHITDSEAVGNIVVGMRDGLTVPLLLAAELSGTADTSC